MNKFIEFKYVVTAADIKFTAAMLAAVADDQYLEQEELYFERQEDASMEPPAKPKLCYSGSEEGCTNQCPEDCPFRAESNPF